MSEHRMTDRVGTVGDAHAPIARAFARASEQRALGQSGRFSLLLKVRTGKTTASIAQLGCWLSTRPDDICGYYTYSPNVAEAKVSKLRGYERRLVWGGVNDMPGSGMRFTGVVVVDDPFAGIHDSQPKNMARAWDFLVNVSSRLEGGASLIVVQSVGLALVTELAEGWESVRCISKVWRRRTKGENGGPLRR